MGDQQDVIVQLRLRKWVQGSLLRVSNPKFAWQTFVPLQAGNPGDDLTETTAAHWKTHVRQMPESESLIVSTQTCDLIKPLDVEPVVEAFPTFWTDNKDKIHSARRNSSRYYVLDTRVSRDGREEALLGDASRPVILDKNSLAVHTPDNSFVNRGRAVVNQFRSWAGDRHSREPLPTGFVEAVQRPIVKAIEKLKPTHRRQAILDQIDLILCFVTEDGPPMQVGMFLVTREEAEESSLSAEDLDDIGGWIADAVKKAGQAIILDYQPYTTRTLSLWDYENAYELPLDRYSLDGDEIASDHTKLSESDKAAG